MKLRYFVSVYEQDDGYHQMHHENCTRLLNPDKRIDIGVHESLEEAMRSAHYYYTGVSGCIHCCKPCNTEPGIPEMHLTIVK